MSGPFTGTKVLELAAIGPAPFAAMMLADMGAEVLRIDRPRSVSPRAGPDGGPAAGSAGAAAGGAGAAPVPDGRAAATGDLPVDLLGRGRRSVIADLKHPLGTQTVRELAEVADVLIEGFRPGVAERLGIGPEELMKRNPRLVYTRVTGWGQTGPLARTAGHDINYVALSGVLHAIGPRCGPPVVPLNVVGDFGGGGMLAAFGIASALFERSASGLGQVLDVAMLDGAALLSTFVRSLLESGQWVTERGSNILDGGAPFYDVYRCSDGEYLAVGPLEPRFMAELMSALQLPVPGSPGREGWHQLREDLRTAFAARPSGEWASLLDGRDVCVTPVLSLSEAPLHPHNVARSTFVRAGGRLQPAPAPRFHRTPGSLPPPAPEPGAQTVAALADWGIATERVQERLASGALQQLA
ncbi:MAG: CaiB/BaiF CoA transferase family protein [Acidimicrobiales bacterium]